MQSRIKSMNNCDNNRNVDSKNAAFRDIDQAISLRPHHLFCTQGYSGKGYSDEFTVGMDRVAKKLREDPGATVEITFSSDSICAACPKRYEEGKCLDDAKVLLYDARVREILGLEEKRYSYHELIDRLDTYIMSGDGDELLRAICGDCEWYPVSACSRNILSNRYVKTSE